MTGVLPGHHRLWRLRGMRVIRRLLCRVLGHPDATDFVEEFAVTEDLRAGTYRVGGTATCPRCGPITWEGSPL